MNQFLRKISFRYLFHKGSNSLSSQTLLTSLGVGLGTAVLIIVLSVMNGFENELQKRILGVIPHVTLESSGGFKDIENISKSISDHNDVAAVAPFLSSQIVIIDLILILVMIRKTFSLTQILRQQESKTSITASLIKSMIIHWRLKLFGKQIISTR